MTHPSYVLYEIYRLCCHVCFRIVNGVTLELIIAVFHNGPCAKYKQTYEYGVRKAIIHCL